MNVKRMYLGACAGVLGLGLLAAASTAWFDYTFNLTHSLPGTFYVVHKGEPFKKGDLVAFRWRGGATYPPGVTFIKYAEGVAGDTVRRVGNKFWVNDKLIGVAKPFTKAGIPLTPSSAGVIRPGEYFVATPSKDSFDSRYSMVGNVKQAEVIGRAYEIF